MQAELTRRFTTSTKQMSSFFKAEGREDMADRHVYFILLTLFTCFALFTLAWAVLLQKWFPLTLSIGVAPFLAIGIGRYTNRRLNLQNAIVMVSIVQTFWIATEGQRLGSPLFAWFSLLILMGSLLLTRYVAAETTLVFMGFTSIVAFVRALEPIGMIGTPLHSLTLWLLWIVTVAILVEIIVQQKVQLCRANETLTTQIEARTEELRLTNATFAAREANLCQLLAQLPAPIIISRHSRVLFMNQASLQLIHLPSLDEAQNHSLLDWLPTEKMREEIRQRLQLIEQGVQLPSVELVFKGDRQEPLTLEIYSNAITFDDEPAVLTVLFDITERKRTEQALRDQQHFIERVTKTIPGALYLFDQTEKRPVLLNHRLVEALGYTAEEAQAVDEETWWELFHPEDRALVTTNPWRANSQQEGEVNQLEYRLQTVQGDYRWLRSWETVFTRNAAHAPVQILGIAQDVTEQKQLQQALADSEAKSRSLIKNIPAVILLITDHEGCVEASTFAAALLGYSQEELLHQPLAAFVGEGQPQTIQELAALTKPGSTIRPEITLKSKEGRNIPVVCQAASNILPGLHLFIAFDISKRLGAEEQLRKSEEHFRVLVEQSPAIIYRGEWVGYPLLTYITPNVKQILGYQDQELLQQASTLTQFYHAEDATRFFDAVQTSRPVGYGKFEYRVRRKGGAYRWLLNHWQFLPDSNEYVGYMLDITKRKVVEKALAHSRSKLRKLTTRLNAIHEDERLYLAREVHDVLGQNLAVLKIRLEQLLNDLPESHNPIRVKVEKLTQVVDNTVDHVQRLTARLRPLMLDELGLTPAIESLAYDFADQAAFTIDLDLPDQSPNLERDLAIALYRIVQEALTNVARHAKASHIQVILELTNNEVQLTIQDNGCGFDTNRARSQKSLGIMGMTERVAPWDGALHITSALGQGTTVHVVVPLPKRMNKAAGRQNFVPDNHRQSLMV